MAADAGALARHTGGWVPPAGQTAAPDVQAPPRETESAQPREAILPPYSVVLHNDDHNDMLHVVQSLLKAVPRLGRARAVTIMLEAHNRGKAVVTTCPLELAELYRDRLQSFGLTATIQKC